ncbi:MAG: hypothetical protein AABX84_01300, partial [Nanoarchaeota archaeon]
WQKAQLIMLRADAYAEIVGERLGIFSSSVENGKTLTTNEFFGSGQDNVQTQEGKPNIITGTNLMNDFCVKQENRVTKVCNEWEIVLNTKTDAEFEQKFNEFCNNNKNAVGCIGQTEIAKQTNSVTLESALTKTKNKDGSYSKNKEFVDQLYKDKFLTEKEYKEITGEGILNLEEDISYVQNLLEFKEIKQHSLFPTSTNIDFSADFLESRKWDAESAMTGLGIIEKKYGTSATYSKNHVFALFVDDLLKSGVLMRSEAGQKGVLEKRDLNYFKEVLRRKF